MDLSDTKKISQPKRGRKALVRSKKRYPGRHGNIQVNGRALHKEMKDKEDRQKELQE